jgi:integrase
VKQRPDGRWRARYRDPHGIERARHFDTKREALRWSTEQERMVRRGEWIDPRAARITLDEYVSSWLQVQRWRPSTVEQRRSLLRCHVLPAFGSRPLGSVRTSEVQAFAVRLSERLAPGTTANIVSLLGSIYRAARVDGLVTSNPVEGVRRGYHGPAVTIPDREAIDALAAAAPDRLRVAVTLAAGVGLRSGEARGLTVDRIDFLRRRLVVDRQLLTTTAGGTSFGPPKNVRSVRTIPLGSEVLDVLARHVEVHGVGVGGLLLVDEWERPLSRGRWEDQWDRVQRDAGVRVRYHDLRHWHASVLLSAGVPIATVAQLLGHTPAVLLRTYAHVLEGDHDRARAAIDEVFADYARTSSRR